MASRSVAIVGAGPVGLSAALFLIEQGVPVVVFERSEEPHDDPRAATFHPPTLEMLAPSGVTDQLLEQGIIADRWQVWRRNAGLVAEFDLSVLSADTAFPFRLQFEQHKLVKILLKELTGRPDFQIRFGESVTSVEQDAGAATVTTEFGRYEFTYVLGADGGRSLVRKSQDISFEGFSYPERFLVVTSTYDFEPEGFAYSCYIADPEEWAALFKVPGEGPPGLWRIVFPTDPEEVAEALLDRRQAERRLDRLTPRPKPYEIVHTNLYQVHQRVAGTFRRGRVLLLGDAAHVNNPLGGMGMNFGIHDAQNLARKLAEVLLATGDAGLLDLYDRQRRGAAATFLQTMTIQNKKTLEEKDPRVAEAGRALLRRTAADPALARAHLLRTSMIDGLRAADAIE